MINNNSPLNKSGFIEELLNASSSKISNCWRIKAWNWVKISVLFIFYVYIIYEYRGL